MELADLLEVWEQQFPVVEDYFRGRGFVHRPHVAADNLLYVSPEFLFSFDQFTNHCPGKW